MLYLYYKNMGCKYEKNITLVIIIIAAVAAILVSAINIKGFSVTESSKKFKQEYESINDKVSEKVVKRIEV